MSRYWYFPATLPGFLFGSPPPLGFAEFEELCTRHLSSEDAGEVLALLRNFGGKSAVDIEDGLNVNSMRAGFSRQFVSWEGTFRNELATLRARKAGKNEEKYLRPITISDDAKRAAAVCYSVEDPLQAEVAVEKERWLAVEKIAALSSFSLDFVLAYGIKLAIAQRLAQFETKTGMAGYVRYYSEILGGETRTAGAESSGESK